MLVTSRLTKFSIMSGIVGIAVVASVLTNAGNADTTNQPSATPTTVSVEQPAATVNPTPAPLDTPIASVAPATLQDEVNNHEQRITVLEAATPVPEPAVVTTPAPTPSPTPIVPYCNANGSICVGN